MDVDDALSKDHHWLADYAQSALRDIQELS